MINSIFQDNEEGRLKIGHMSPDLLDFPLFNGGFGIFRAMKILLDKREFVVYTVQ
jgi:hypothetical protein